MQWCKSNSATSRMPKLYYCASSHQGVSVFLAAYMSCVYLDCEAVLIGEGLDMKTASGADYGEISLGCRLPCLVFEDGNVITQEPVILEYVADKVSTKPNVMLYVPYFCIVLQRKLISMKSKFVHYRLRVESHLITVRSLGMK